MIGSFNPNFERRQPDRGAGRLGPRIAIVALVAIGTGPAAAAAAPAGAASGATAYQGPAARPGVAHAKQLNAEATRLFSLGLFDQAARRYHEAYLAFPAPAFLFNLGQCQRRIGGKESLEKAVFSFESTLRNTRDQALLRAARKQLKRARQELAELARRAPPIYQRWWFWTAIGVAAASTTAAILLAQPGDPQEVRGTLPPYVVSLP